MIPRLIQNEVLRTLRGSSGWPHLWLMKISSSTLSSIPKTFLSSFISSFLSWSVQKEARAAEKVAWAMSVSERPQDWRSSTSWTFQPPVMTGMPALMLHSMLSSESWTMGWWCLESGTLPDSRLRLAEVTKWILFVLQSWYREMSWMI